MKAPKLDAQALGDFLLKHAEKFGIAVLALGALWLLWGGLSAIQSLSVTEALSPDSVSRAAASATSHIDRDAEPPADLLPPRQPLADLVDPWRKLVATKPTASTVFSRPLFAEAAKRSKPDVLPVEDLRAVAGLALVAVEAPPDKGRGSDRRSARPDTPPPDGGEPQTKIMPYVVVTGLIPAGKQTQEYGRRFSETSYRDPKRDAPLWCDYEIDRATVGPDGKETWTPINLGVVARRLAVDPSRSPAAAAARAEYELTAAEERLSVQTTPLPFSGPLPARIDGGWNLTDVHPWVAERMAAKLAAPEATAQSLPDQQPADPGFETSEQKPLAPPVAPVAATQLPEYRQFRFVDTAVVPGATYRYRVRLKVWNPNYSKNPEEMRPHLTDPAQARELKLTSPDSQPSAAATVPDPTRVLVDTLRPETLKELKIRPGSGTLELLVIGPSTVTGGLALRALIADPGAVIDVDEKHNVTKAQRDRARGERIATGRLFVDARGRQEDRHGIDKGKAAGVIPEPLEVICLRPDGSFEVASAADSEPAIAEHRDTLPPRGAKAETRPQGPVMEPLGVPGFDPLARPGARP